MYIPNYESENLNVLWVYGQFQELYKQNIDNVNINYSDFLPNQDEYKNLKGP